ncbi:hypothetical protein PHLCEN_2v782, partial [Hermanssonia centrifuga]
MKMRPRPPSAEGSPPTAFLNLIKLISGHITPAISTWPSCAKAQPGICQRSLDAHERFADDGERDLAQQATIQPFHPFNINPLPPSETPQHREFLVPKPAQSPKAKSRSMWLKTQHSSQDVYGRDLLVGQSYFIGTRPTTRHMQQSIHKVASISSYATKLIHRQPKPIGGPDSTISQPPKRHTVTEGPTRKMRPIATYAHSTVHSLYTHTIRGPFPVGPPIGAHKAPAATTYADSISDIDTTVSSRKLSELGPAISRAPTKDKDKALEDQAGESRLCIDGHPVGPPKGSRKPTRATSILESISSVDSTQSLPKLKPTRRKPIAPRPNGKGKEREENKLSELEPVISRAPTKDKDKALEDQAGESRLCIDGHPVGPPKGSRKPTRATSILESISSVDSTQSLPKLKPTRRKPIAPRPNGKGKEREEKADDAPWLAEPP